MPSLTGEGRAKPGATWLVIDAMMPFSWKGMQLALDLLHPVAGVVEARAFRRDDADDDGAAILDRGEFLLEA